jgi:SARP family transcriptional regulator, regulator of embCAB operon
VRISLTGRVSIEANGTSLDETRFPGRQARLVFAYLLAEHGKPVPRAELAEALWGEAPPATWEKALAVLVSKLRALLEECGVDGQAALTIAFGCYQLMLPGGAWIDVAAATQYAEQAETALPAGDPAEAQASAAAAATLARRTFLPGEDGSWVEEKRRELHDLVVRSLECLADASLKLGDTGEAVKHAEEVTALEPFRESGYRRLMLAHSAAGNNAEALRVYERCRRLLADEIGAYPSPETESLYLEVLRAMPAEAQTSSSIDEVPDTGSTRRSRVTLTRLVALGVAAAAVIATVFAAVTRSSGSDLLARLDSDAVGAIDAEGRVTAQVALGDRPTALVPGGGFLWVAGQDGTVSRIDPATRAIRTVDIGESAAGLVYESGTLWATMTAERAIAQINPETLAVLQTKPVGNGPTGIAAGAGSVWVANTIDGTVSKVDLASGAVTAIPVGGRPSAIAVGAGTVWVANQEGATIVGLDPRSLNVVAAIRVGNGPAGIAAGEQGIWVANRQDGTVSRIDPATTSVSTTIPVGVSPASVAVGDDAIWVAVSGEGTIVRWRSPPGGSGSRLSHRSAVTAAGCFALSRPRRSAPASTRPTPISARSVSSMTGCLRTGAWVEWPEGSSSGTSPSACRP